MKSMLARTSAVLIGGLIAVGGASPAFADHPVTTGTDAAVHTSPHHALSTKVDWAVADDAYWVGYAWFYRHGSASGFGGGEMAGTDG